MLIRAVIVVLLMLNVGVAAWWLTRAPQQAAPATSLTNAGVPRLRLADERQAEIATGAAAGDSATPGGAAPAPPERCASHGPFASAEAAAEARRRLQPLGARTRVRTETAGPHRGWKVWLPPFASLEEVEAASARVAAAGFSDRFIVRDGIDANSLALGRFAAEAPARQHAATLVAAGFPARAEPIGSGPVSHWLDVAAPAGLAARVRSLAAATEARELDCARLP